jgi:lysophospholipase L1-like esterase
MSFNVKIQRGLGQWFAWGCFAAGLLLFVIVGGMVWRGRPWAFIVYAEKPIPHFLAGVAAWLVWYVLVFGRNDIKGTLLRFAGRSVLVLVSAVLSFAVAEVAVRAVLMGRQQDNSLERLKKLRQEGRPIPIKSANPLAAIIEPSDDTNLFYELMPNMDMLFGSRTLKTNADSMRESRDYAIEKRPDTVRILGIGDSGMFGWGLDQDHDYLAVLERTLGEQGAGRTYEVMNLAVPGYNTQLEVEALRSKGLKYHPDIVVVGWCVNDFYLPFFMLQKENFARRDRSYVWDFLFHRSRFYDAAAGHQFVDRHTFDLEQVDEHMKAGTDVAGVTRAMEDLKALSDQEGFRVLVFGPMSKDIIDVCKAVDVPYYCTFERIPLDAYPLEWAIHTMHPRKEGHAVLAQKLKEHLESMGWLASGAAASAPEAPVPDHGPGGA